jgi:cytosine/adenosine deaminase-related metal-dependent hydrolase
MLLSSGTTTIADTESVPELPPESWKSTPLRLISFFEITGVKSQRRADDLVREALDWIDRWPRDDRKEAGLSPHALYSTVPELMRKSAMVARDAGLLLSVHLAESEAEYAMFADAKGPFHDWLKGQRTMDDCGLGSPVRVASQYGILTERALVIHANYLAPGDIETLALSRASVVHCPRSHEYFGHVAFRYDELVKAGVNVCLATDSLASTKKVNGRAPELNLWHELQCFARTHAGVSPREILRAATINPAKALGKSGQIGALDSGAFADMAAMSYTGRVDEPRMIEEILYNFRVREVFISGELVQTPSEA